MRRNGQFLLRVLAVTLCLGALFDPRPFRTSSDELPVAIIDVSSSVGAAPASRVPESVQVHPRRLLVADGLQETVGDTDVPRMSRQATRLGLAGKSFDLSTDDFRRPGGSQMALF